MVPQFIRNTFIHFMTLESCVSYSTVRAIETGLQLHGKQTRHCFAGPVHYVTW